MHKCDEQCEVDDAEIMNPMIYSEHDYSNEGMLEKHRSSYSVNKRDSVCAKSCEFDGCCSIAPNYNFPGSSFGRFCGLHKVQGMVNLKSLRCEVEGCETIPVFDFVGGKGRFCGKHKQTGMMNVKNKVCKYDGCKVNPVFDYPGGKGKYCAVHKLPDMIDVKHKRCEFNGCSTLNPAFDYIDGKGRFCSVHKSADMINVKSRKCESTSCTSIAPVVRILHIIPMSNQISFFKCIFWIFSWHSMTSREDRVAFAACTRRRAW